MSQLRIAVISKSDSSGGGASRVAEHLSARLNGVDGVEAHHWMAYPAGDADHGRSLYDSRAARGLQWIGRKVSNLTGLCDFLTPEAWFFERRTRALDYDLIHFHDISRSFSPIGLRWLARRKPVVWTFHDCSPFTGGCIYPMECRAFESHCNHCPRLGAWPLTTRIDFTRFMQAYKRKTARMGLFTPIAPSNWMARRAVKAGFFDAPPVVIPYGVDTQRFRPLDRRMIRRLHGFDEDLFTVVVAAGNLGSPFKGTKYAIEAVNRLDRKVQVLFVGTPDHTLIARCAAERVHVLGLVNEDRLLSQYLAAADVYLFPTLEDNLPNSVLETLACGTPTVGFRTGGVPDMVESGKNGVLVERGDVEGLIVELRNAADNPGLRQAWSRAARDKALSTYAYDRFIDNHISLYKQVIHERKTPVLPLANERPGDRTIAVEDGEKEDREKTSKRAS